jgi:hypothetical protein
MPIAAIIRRLDAALASMAAQGMEPRAIYLTQADYESLARCRTRRWRRETGSSAFVWPCSYGDVILVSGGLADQLEVPVREGKGKRGSTIYSKHGVSVAVPRFAPK